MDGTNTTDPKTEIDRDILLSLVQENKIQWNDLRFIAAVILGRVTSERDITKLSGLSYKAVRVSKMRLRKVFSCFC